MTTQAATGNVSFAGLEKYPLPTICTSRWLGLRCPTCGVTRSVIALMHGSFTQSLEFHRFGWLILLFILAQVPYRTYRLIKPEQRLPRLEWLGIISFLALGIIVVLGHFSVTLGLL